MLARTRSGAVYGVDAHPVDVEVHVTSGGNGDFEIVGLPDAAIRESRSRIRAAIRNSDFEVPHHRITINLAPAGLRKEGSSFDLPMAVGILSATRTITGDLREFLLVGELALDGHIRGVRGALSIALMARNLGIPNVLLPAENAPEASLAPEVSIYPFETLRQVVLFLKGESATEPYVRQDPVRENRQSGAEDFSDVRGQRHARRAVEVAIAGGHNIFMVGPPGSGKTMLARRIPSIIPPMTREESLETTRVYSAAGLLANGGLKTERPFRAPHHTVSRAGLVGGGSVPRPGEVTLAHNGVLFLDELPEFPRHALEALRQPLEEGQVTLTRARMTLTFPATLVLAAAMNPCRCGYHGDPRHECACTPKQIRLYRSRVSGPLIDRMDIQIEVPAVSYGEISDGKDSETSETIRARVVRAREIQLERFARSETRTNARMLSSHIRKWCALDKNSSNLLEEAITKLGISARGWNRLLKVARTIADLDASKKIEAGHIAEAIRYRRTETTMSV